MANLPPWLKKGTKMREEEKKEPQKQTLLEFINSDAGMLKSETRAIYANISAYMEQNKCNCKN